MNFFFINALCVLVALFFFLSLILSFSPLNMWKQKLFCIRTKDLVDTYGLDNDDYAEELEEACADIQDTLEADNYEDQLPQPEVICF